MKKKQERQRHIVWIVESRGLWSPTIDVWTPGPIMTRVEARLCPSSDRPRLPWGLARIDPSARKIRG